MYLAKTEEIIIKTVLCSPVARDEKCQVLAFLYIKRALVLNKGGTIQS